MTDKTEHIQARAFVRGTRPGAVPILRETADDPAAYWAEPAQIAAAMALFEEAGIAAQRVDRVMLLLSGPAAAFETAFSVTLARDAEGGWEAHDAAGAPLDVVPPATDAQRAVLQGVVVGGPVDAPAKTQAEHEADWVNPPNATLPHQLRAELSEARLDAAALAALPTGKGAHVLVFDSGWDSDHPYWDAVGLRAAADAVTFEENQLYVAVRNLVVDDINELELDLGNIQQRLDVADTAQASAQGTQARKAAEAARVAICREIYLVASGNPLNMDDIARKAGALRAFMLDPRAILANQTAFAAALDRMRDQVSDDQFEITEGRDASESYGDPHGSEVISQVLAIAPGAQITIIPNRTSRGGSVSGFFSRMRPNFESGVTDVPSQIDRVNADILSLSYISGKSLAAIRARSPSMLDYLARLDAQVRDQQERTLWVTAAGNDTQALKRREVPPGSGTFIDAPELAMPNLVTRGNVLTVGGAYRAARHDPGADRSVHPSDAAAGYSLQLNDPLKPGVQKVFMVPGVCGLMGSRKAAMTVVPSFAIDPSVGLPDPVMRLVTGTSFAAPQVAGVAALLIERMRGDVQPAVLARTLRETAKAIDAVGRDDFAVPPGTRSRFHNPAVALEPGLVDLESAVNRVAYTAVEERRARAVLVQHTLGWMMSRPAVSQALTG